MAGPWACMQLQSCPDNGSATAASTFRDRFARALGFFVQKDPLPNAIVKKDYLQIKTSKRTP